MKILLPCLQCNASAVPTPCHATLNNNLVFDITCEHGHTGKVILQASKHQILFELGMMALNDGYIRESVTSVAVALERFYEFATKILCFDIKLDENTIKKTWAVVAKQSERQYGAYVFTNLIVTKREPDNIYTTKLNLGSGHGKNSSRNWIELRNAVTHNGEIPTKEEAHYFAKITYDFIVKETSYLKKHHANGYTLTTRAIMDEMNKIPIGTFVSTAHYPTMLDDITNHKDGKSFEDAFESMKGYRRNFFANY